MNKIKTLKDQGSNFKLKLFDRFSAIHGLQRCFRSSLEDRAGLADGSLEREGGVVRDSSRKQIVNLKTKFLVLPVLALTGVTFIAGCSQDIKVVSDLGEASVVKKSAVSSYKFDNALTEERLINDLKTMENGLRNCPASKAYCNEIWQPEIYSKNKDIETIKTMPEVTIVKYRTINTNVNGDKFASPYKYVACLPDGEAAEQLEWHSLIRRTEPEDKEVSSNLVDDGTVASSINTRVCEIYGNA